MGEAFTLYGGSECVKLVGRGGVSLACGLHKVHKVGPTVKGTLDAPRAVRYAEIRIKHVTRLLDIRVT